MLLSAMVFFVLLFLGLALGAPCIRPMYVGVPCFFTNLCIPSFTYKKKLSIMVFLSIKNSLNQYNAFFFFLRN